MKLQEEAVVMVRIVEIRGVTDVGCDGIVLGTREKARGHVCNYSCLGIVRLD
jgi:hypothetical protein